ncbi:MAG TPA: SPOR domain-containing protein [Lysobacter sp.]|nr:SPOR domain-containing protein [Lysobacter sp.]
MAAKRGKSQARRNGGGNSGSIPGWAWAVLGALLAVVVILVAPKYLKADGDGFFRPQPNPDAQPVPVAEDEDAVAPEGNPTSPKADAPKGDSARDKGEGPEYDFYTLLPGKEVPLSDAEIAATERAEAQRLAAQQKQQTVQADPQAATVTAAAQDNLPQPVDSGADTAAAQPQPPKQVASATPPASTTASSPGNAPAASTLTDDNTRYLLQAGAFQASGQAEEMKAKIALLGLGARVESAQIGGKTVYRVRMGPYGTAGDLADAKRKLSAGGLPAMAIKVK